MPNLWASPSPQTAPNGREVPLDAYIVSLSAWTSCSHDAEVQPLQCGLQPHIHSVPQPVVHSEGHIMTVTTERSEKEW